MVKASARLISVLLAIGVPIRAPHADEPGASELRIPGLPPIHMPNGVRGYLGEPTPGSAGPKIAKPDIAKPDDNIYHEFGTVTPGGGRRAERGLGDDSGGMVVGPGGVVRPQPNAGRRTAVPKKPPPPTLEEKQAQIRKALTPKPPLAFARRHTLDELYAKLSAAGDEDEAKGLASLISAIWMRSGSDTANLLMSRADKAIDAKHYDVALQILDHTVDLQPNWAEAWNKRAAARYLAGDLDGAMADVDHVLKLEPNHFGALNGMAIILERTGFNKRALQIYRRELEIYPHQPELEKTIEKLTLQVEGQGI